MVLVIFVAFPILLFLQGFMLLKNRKLAMRSLETAQVFFEDVRVPSKNLVSEEGKGFTYQML